MILIQYGSVINDIAANAAEASRTATIDCSEADHIAIGYSLVHSAATAMTLTVYGSLDGGTTYKRLQSANVAGGTVTLTDATWSKAVSGDASEMVDLPVWPYTHLKVIAGATGGGASDKITVQINGRR